MDGAGYDSITNYLLVALTSRIRFPRKCTVPDHTKVNACVDVGVFQFEHLTCLYCTLQTVQIYFTMKYRRTSDIRRTLVGNKTVDHSDAVGQLHLHSRLNTWLQWIGQRQL